MYFGRLEPSQFAAWIGVVALATIAVAWAWRVARRREIRPTRAAWWLLAPWGAVGATLLAFTIGRSHPLAQYNDATTRALWSWWAGAWPVLLLGSFAATGVGAVAAVVRAARAAPDRVSAGLAWAAVAGASAITLFSVALNFPDC